MLETLPPMPIIKTTSNTAGNVLGEFIYWLRDFLVDLSENTNQTTINFEFLFEQEQISLFPPALNEVINDGHFDKVYRLITNPGDETIQRIIAHGLYGDQLQFKLSNIQFSFNRFINQRTASLFDKLLSSIDTLLDSILDAVPGGSAIKELKDAVSDSIALVTE